MNILHSTAQTVPIVVFPLVMLVCFLTPASHLVYLIHQLKPRADIQGTQEVMKSYPKEMIFFPVMQLQEMKFRDLHCRTYSKVNLASKYIEITDWNDRLFDT